MYLIVRRQLNAIKSKPLAAIFSHVHDIHRSVQRMDGVVSLYLLLKFAVDTMICVSTLCIMLIYPGDNNYGNMGHNLLSAVLLLYQCLVCEIIPHSLDSLINHLDKRFVQQNCQSMSDQINTNLLLIRLNHYERRNVFHWVGYVPDQIGHNTVVSVTDSHIHNHCGADIASIECRVTRQTRSRFQKN